MNIYNSKTKIIERFKPIKEGFVTMYVCGPTVYNEPHIGNARPIVVFDLLRRVLEAQNYDVKLVSNFTDVDDRIIQKALDEAVDETTITKRYIEAYNKVRHELNAMDPNATPYATEVIDEIIEFIVDLIDKGFAYEVAGDVYFRVTKVKDYGEISSQNIEDLMVGARIEKNPNKENPLDFALWKQTADEGIKWSSPWGEGRPGWHTECVVMIQNEFKQNTIDIHGGGQDLRFPHHENESAQAKAIHHHDLANYWVHNAMVNIDGIKMSKSLGNVRWAQDYIDTFGTNVTRWLLLSTHYRLILNITDEIVAQAQSELGKIQQAYRQAVLELELNDIAQTEAINETVFESFMDALNDDLNVANATVVVFDLIKALNQSLRVRDKDLDMINANVHTLEKMLNILGIDMERIALTPEDKELFREWNAAKADKDFTKADAFRLKLTERGLI